MRLALTISVLVVLLLGGPTIVAAQGTQTGSHVSRGDPFSSDPEAPGNVLREVEEAEVEREALFPRSPLGGLRNRTDQAKQTIYEATGFKMGLVLQQVGQGISEVQPGFDNSGTAADLDFVVQRALINRGQTNVGGVYYQLQGRWDYGTTGPQDLGFVSLASAGGTANAWSRYQPTFLTRNFYWQHGSEEAGWAYRIGKITADQTFLSSKYISPVTTFLPNVGTGVFAAGFPDSGLGAVFGFYPSDRVSIVGLISDANANRVNFGDIGAGDTYKGVQLGVKLLPITPKAGYSKFLLWQSDGTKNGQPINAMTGQEGWGFAMKIEQELTRDGRAVGIFRYGRSYDDSAIWKQQAGLSFVLNDPVDPIRIKNDMFGIAINWVESVVAGSREEYNFETFYRFALFPAVDATLSYQSVFDPALTTEIDQASVFSFRLRTTY